MCVLGSVVFNAFGFGGIYVVRVCGGITVVNGEDWWRHDGLDQWVLQDEAGRCLIWGRTRPFIAHNGGCWMLFW